MSYDTFDTSQRERILSRKAIDFLDVRADELPNHFDRYRWTVSAAIISSNTSDLPDSVAAYAHGTFGGAGSMAMSVAEHAAESRERGKANFEMFRAPPPTMSAPSASFTTKPATGRSQQAVSKAKAKFMFKTLASSSGSNSSQKTSSTAGPPKSSISTNTTTTPPQHAVLVLRKSRPSTIWTFPHTTLDPYDVSTVRNTLTTLVLSSTGLHISSVLGSLGVIVIEDPASADEYGKIRLDFVVCVREVAGVEAQDLVSVELDLGEAYSAAKWLESEGDIAGLEPCEDSVRELILNAYDFCPSPEAKGKGPVEKANWNGGWQVAGQTLKEEKQGMSGLEEYLAGTSLGGTGGGERAAGDGGAGAKSDDWFAGTAVKRPGYAEKKKNSAWKTPRKP